MAVHRTAVQVSWVTQKLHRLEVPAPQQLFHINQIVYPNCRWRARYLNGAMPSSASLVTKYLIPTLNSQVSLAI